MKQFNQSEYINQYKKDHYKRISLQLNVESDADIIAILDNVPNKNEYIKNLIRKASE